MKADGAAMPADYDNNTMPGDDHQETIPLNKSGIRMNRPNDYENELGFHDSNEAPSSAKNYKNAMPMLNGPVKGMMNNTQTDYNPNNEAGGFGNSLGAKSDNGAAPNGRNNSLAQADGRDFNSSGLIAKGNLNTDRKLL